MDNKIKLQPKVKYALSECEIRRMLLSMALVQYRFLRRPEYDEQKLLKLLLKDLSEFTAEMTRLSEANRNNHTISKLYTQINKYHVYLKQLVNSEIISSNLP